MARCFPASGDTTSLKRGWKFSRRSWLRMTALVFFSGVLSAAGTVAAARAPDPQAAYGPPPTPETFRSAEIEPSVTADLTPVAVAEVFSAPMSSEPAPAAEVGVREAAVAAEAPAVSEAPTTETPAVETASSTTVSPKLVASSWSMEPLPEEPPAEVFAAEASVDGETNGDGDAVVASSATDRSPDTQTSSLLAAPR